MSVEDQNVLRQLRMDKRSTKTRITLLTKTIEKELHAEYPSVEAVKNHFKVLNEYNRDLKSLFQKLFRSETDTEKINKLAGDELDCRLNYNATKDHVETFIKTHDVLAQSLSTVFSLPGAIGGQTDISALPETHQERDTSTPFPMFEPSFTADHQFKPISPVKLTFPTGAIPKVPQLRACPPMPSPTSTQVTKYHSIVNTSDKLHQLFEKSDKTNRGMYNADLQKTTNPSVLPVSNHRRDGTPSANDFRQIIEDQVKKILAEKSLSANQSIPSFREDPANQLSIINVNRSRSNHEQSFQTKQFLGFMQSNRLEPMKINSFDGNYDKWEEFRDVYEAMIHNTPLSEVDKFQRLNTLLTGNARRFVDKIKLTANNYIIVWTDLKRYYDNPRRIAASHAKGIINIKQAQSETADHIRSVLSAFQGHIRALTTANLENNAEILQIEILLSKLDENTRMKWESKMTTTSTIPKLQDLYDLVEKRIRVLEVSPQSSQRGSTSQFRPSRNRIVTNVAIQDSTTECPICKGDHRVYACKKLINAPVEQKLPMVYESNLCKNCLRTDHFVKDCPSKHCRVKDCTYRHHTLLHEAFTNQKPAINLSPVVTSLARPETVLATVLLLVSNSKGSYSTVRALLDGGSQRNFMTHELCHKLQLSPHKEVVDISGIGKSTSSTHQSVEVHIKSHSSSHEDDINCLLMENITELLPQSRLNIDDWNIPKEVKLADQDFHIPGRIDMLLSAGIFFESLLGPIMPLGQGKPRLFETKFGWIIAGGDFCYKISPRPATCQVVTHKTISKQLEKFWTLEAFPDDDNFRSKEDKECERHFIETTKHIKNRFEVRLPFKIGRDEIKDNNRKRAEACWLSTERHFAKDDKIRAMYDEFMQKYLELGHMTPVCPTDKMQYFIPHHHVWKSGKKESKFRVVFNASSKSRANLSLNDVLMIGPIIQQDLTSILIRFRTYLVAVVGDIEKMYRQVSLHPDDQVFQGIIYRTSPDEPLKAYKLTTLTYGTAPAAFLATRCLKEAIERQKDAFPDTCHRIFDDFYVDDLISGSHNTADAIQYIKDAQSILINSEFPIKKFLSNDDAVMKTIPPELRASESTPVDLQMETNTKTLGMTWNPKSDTFKFVTSELNDTHTKRNILSDIAKLFDPLGLVGPVVVTAKYFMQLIWKSGLDWDEQLPPDLENKWKSYKLSFRQIDTIDINRCITTETADVNYLIGFADASEICYGACIYLVRYDTHTANVTSNLICSKSRIAPVKTKSIPKLELSAALLLAELINTVKKTLKLDIKKIRCFSDSMIVLSWLKKDPSNWKPFVANRTSRIQELTEIDSWSHVSTDQNPADVLSRGCDPIELKSNALWWNGPKNFIEKVIFGDEQQNLPNLNSVDLDLISNERKTVTLISVASTNKFYDDLFTRHSCYEKIIRISAIVLRFINNCRLKSSEMRTTGRISYNELTGAEFLLARIAQQMEFASEIRETKMNLPVTSKLSSLTPYWDHKLELMRVGGRIDNANLPFNRRHPIILPEDAKFTTLLFQSTHKGLLHAGPRNLLNHIRNKWWPINGKRIASSVVHKCNTCFKFQPRFQTQIMGNLPSYRINPSKPFLNTGIDFAGPINTLQHEGQRCRVTKKSYICLFVCCSTKAVHIEPVSALSTEAFLACLKRFIARRGAVRNIYSDNGLNFVGARNEIQKIITQQDTKDSMTRQFPYLNWEFIPASSPHMGGIWEANIKSMKSHLYKVMGKTLLNFEHFTTLLCQIEACLNSRPICVLNNNIDDLSILTPGHFLTFDSLTSIPEEDFTEINSNRLKKWCLIQRIVQQFWKYWQTDYLDSLQKRYKWKEARNNLKIDDIVLVKDDNLKPTYWSYGRVLEVYPDENDKVRFVKLKINGHETKRTIHKLCRLPFQDGYNMGGSDAESSSIIETRRNIETSQLVNERK